MSFLRNLYFFQSQKYTSFGKNILHRQSASLGHSATGHSGKGAIRKLCRQILKVPAAFDSVRELGTPLALHKDTHTSDMSDKLRSKKLYLTFFRVCQHNRIASFKHYFKYTEGMHLMT